MSVATLDSGAPTGLANPPVSTGGGPQVFLPEVEDADRLGEMLYSYCLGWIHDPSLDNNTVRIQNGSWKWDISIEPGKLTFSSTVIRIVTIARPDDYAWLD